VPNCPGYRHRASQDALWLIRATLPQIKNGMITAPEWPGHGLKFKDEVRKDFVVQAGLLRSKAHAAISFLYN
jgi:L-alanine-DL-glutamate epimerase-like enolase superfamily enzyme